jgi:hypothetical protein
MVVNLVKLLEFAKSEPKEWQICVKVTKKERVGMAFDGFQISDWRESSSYIST